MYNDTLRRLSSSSVNIVGVGGGGTNDDNDSDVMRRKFCPREGRLLVFRESINNFFCPECAYEYVSEEEKKRRKQQEQEQQQQEQEQPAPQPPLGSISGLQSKSGQIGSTRNEQEEEILRFRPIPNIGRRSQSLKQLGMKGEDPDADTFKKLGYVVQYSHEDVSQDGTYNSMEEALRRRRDRR